MSSGGIALVALSLELVQTMKLVLDSLGSLLAPLTMRQNTVY